MTRPVYPLENQYSLQAENGWLHNWFNQFYNLFVHKITERDVSHSCYESAKL